jgi:hypothetical protein
MASAIQHLMTAQRIYRSNKCATNAMAYRTGAHKCLRYGGNERYPSGFPDGTSGIGVMDETADTMIDWLKSDATDETVKLEIDSNKLVQLLNTAQSRLALANPERHDETELWQIIEACRDVLGRARRAGNK